MKKGGLNCSHQSHQLLCNAVKVYHPRFLTLSSTKQTNIWLNKKNKKIRPGEDRKLNFNYVKIMSATLKSSNKTTKWSRKLRKRCILVWSTKQNKREESVELMWQKIKKKCQTSPEEKRRFLFSWISTTVCECDSSLSRFRKDVYEAWRRFSVHTLIEIHRDKHRHTWCWRVSHSWCSSSNILLFLCLIQKFSHFCHYTFPALSPQFTSIHVSQFNTHLAKTK